VTRPFALLPEQASTFAARTDALFYFLCAISIVVSAGIVCTLFYFSLRYGRRGEERVPMKGQVLDHEETKRLELAWIAIPLAIFLGIFYWGAKIFAAQQEPPDNALTVYVVGKRWMWKAQHLGGQREINELHVPLGQPVKLVMTSEDVIHSFFVPAFRVKADVLPGRYTTMWFEATKLGDYHLFCAEYCGTKHSQMVGRVVVMEPSAFQRWLGGGRSGTLAEAGEKRFTDLGCVTCHRDDQKGRGPSLRGLFGSQVKLRAGDLVVADEGYLRESILEPRAKQVAGYDLIMPTYATQLGEEGVVELIAYIRSLEAPAGAPRHAAAPGPDAGAEGADAGAEALADAGSGAKEAGEDAGAADADAGEGDAKREESDAGAGR
jgi:cytochrome c oxidase subunit II